MILTIKGILNRGMMTPAAKPIFSSVFITCPCRTPLCPAAFLRWPLGQ
jgi:hypothetical protein